MWSHWAYKSEEVTDTLEQGDVLEKTEDVASLLRTYHPYYESHKDNRFYVVLTQSCDLDRRGTRSCKARYIALAPVRPLKAVVTREFASDINQIDNGTPFSSTRVRGEIERFLERLFNNNEASFFFLEEEAGAGIYEPMCAMLALPIAFKADHYDTLLAAKMIGIEDSFQAKLGWLLGQLYSRVGTRDFEAAILKDKVAGLVDGWAAWLDPKQVEAVKKGIEVRRKADPAAIIDDKVIEEIMSAMPKKKTQVIERVLELAESEGIAANPSSERRALRRALEHDTKLARLLG